MSKIKKFNNNQFKEWVTKNDVKFYGTKGDAQNQVENVSVGGKSVETNNSVGDLKNSEYENKSTNINYKDVQNVIEDSIYKGVGDIKRNEDKK